MNFGGMLVVKVAYKKEFYFVIKLINRHFGDYLYLARFYTYPLCTRYIFGYRSSSSNSPKKV